MVEWSDGPRLFEHFRDLRASNNQRREVLVAGIGGFATRWQ